MRTYLLPLLLVLGAWASVARAQPVDGDVTCVGFRAALAGGTGFIVRDGQWTPIQVKLAVQGSNVFQGSLRCETTDLDGDLISYVEAPVVVNADVGLRADWCYAVFRDDPGSTGTTIDIVNDAGVTVNHLPVPNVELVDADVMLVLDLSTRRLELRGLLETPGWTPGYIGYGSRPFYRDITVARLAADEMPDRWIGFEGADVVIWDEPVLPPGNSPQLAALLEWVRQGGQLIVGLGSSWSGLQGSPLADVLPVEPVQSTRAYPLTMDVTELNEFFQRLVKRGTRDEPDRPRSFREPVTFATVTAKRGAYRSFTVRLPDGPEIDLVAVQSVGAGRVISVAASIGDLLKTSVNEQFVAQLFDIAETTDKFRESEVNSYQLGMGLRHELYDHLATAVSFERSAGLRVIAAFGFVIGYIAAATFLVWFVLKQKGLMTLNWVVFAVFAIVAGTLSLGAVAVMRGVARGVHTLSFVDVEAGGHDASVTSYYGYSSPSRLPIDLSLTTEDGFLRPMARRPGGSGTYATPRRYAASTSDPLLEAAPRRATLKQFEGAGQIELSGAIRAGISVDRRSGEISPASWIQNELSDDLIGGYLLFVDPRQEYRAARPAGTNSNWRRQSDVPMSLNVLVVRIPPLKAGERVSGLSQELYRAVAESVSRWERATEPDWNKRPDLPSLWDEQRVWVGKTPRRVISDLRYRAWQGLDEITQAALMASTRSYYLHDEEDFDKATNAPLSTAGLMNVDVSHWLMQGIVRGGGPNERQRLAGQGMLLLISDDPGPLRLHGAGRELGPLRGRTLYRVRVPIELTNSPPVVGGGG